MLADDRANSERVLHSRTLQLTIVGSNGVARCNVYAGLEDATLNPDASLNKHVQTYLPKVCVCVCLVLLQAAL